MIGIQKYINQIDVIVNEKKQQLYKNMVGELKKQLVQQLKLQKMSQICCIAGDVFLENDANISQYNGPYYFFTAKYVGELENGVKEIMKEYGNHNHKYEQMKIDYQELQKKYQELETKWNEKSSIDDISREIDKEYRDKKQNYVQQSLESFCLEEYVILTNSQQQEIQHKQKQLDDLTKEYNELKIEYGTLKLVIKQKDYDMESDKYQKNNKNNQQQATIDNLNEQISKLKQENKNLENRYRQDNIKQQSTIYRDTVAQEKFKILQKSYNDMRESNQKYIKENFELKEELSKYQLEKQKNPRQSKESVLITQSTQSIIDENINLKLKQQKMEIIQENFKNCQKEKGELYLKQDELTRELIKAQTQIQADEEQIRLLYDKIKTLKQQKQ